MKTRRHVRILWVVGNWENYGEKYQRTNPFFFVDQTTESYLIGASRLALSKWLGVDKEKAFN